MDNDDQYTHSCCAFQADSQENLNRFLDEVNRIAGKLNVSGIPTDLRQALDAWLEREADACERDVQSMIRLN